MFLNTYSTSEDHRVYTAQWGSPHKESTHTHGRDFLDWFILCVGIVLE